MQIVFAGNDSEGLQYGTIGTPEKYFLKWKEDEADNTRFKLDKYLLKMCRKERLIELMHDFVLFDGGVKKLPRVHQYFGIKAAQERVNARQGRHHLAHAGQRQEHRHGAAGQVDPGEQPNARVAIITDRDELDKQIERVFTEAGEAIYRTSSGRDLMSQLGQAKPRLLCSLVHKFGQQGRGRLRRLHQGAEEASPARRWARCSSSWTSATAPRAASCTEMMKAMMPNAVFIGFTGTPLLKKDKQTSLEVFGGYIHTYKFSEAVEDGVVLDLVYEARDIDQRARLRRTRSTPGSRPRPRG